MQHCIWCTKQQPNHYLCYVLTVQILYLYLRMYVHTYVLAHTTHQLIKGLRSGSLNILLHLYISVLYSISHYYQLLNQPKGSVKFSTSLTLQNMYTHIQWRTDTTITRQRNKHSVWHFSSGTCLHCSYCGPLVRYCWGSPTHWIWISPNAYFQRQTQHDYIHPKVKKYFSI